jgi:hypothetical protein
MATLRKQGEVGGDGAGGPKLAAMPVESGGTGGVGRCGDASGREAGPGQNPGGKRSPRKERAADDRQRSEVATDPPAEQRLEVEGRRERAVHSASPEAQRRGGNGARRRATNAAAMQQAAGGGTSSRGVRCVAGTRRTAPQASEPRPSGRGGAASGRQATETRRTPSGTGMQQARNLCAEEAVEVVRNHEDGTSALAWQPASRSRRQRRWEWTRRWPEQRCSGGSEQSGSVGRGAPSSHARANPTRGEHRTGRQRQAMRSARVPAL